MDAWLFVYAAVSLVLPLLLILLFMSWLSNSPPSSSSPSSLPILQPLPSPPSSLSLPAPPPPSTFTFASPADESFFISRLLAEARTSLSADRPMQALSLVLAAVRQQKGEEGVFDALNEAREGYGLQPHVNPVRQARQAREEKERREDVDALMANMSLRPAWAPYQLPAAETGDENAMDEGGEEEEEEGANASVLEERGEGYVLDEALRDREQFLACRRCRGVIARARMQQHIDLWCEATHNTDQG